MSVLTPVLAALAALAAILAPGVGVGSAAGAAPTPYLQIQNISKGVIGETSFGAVSVTYTVKFKCHGAPVGTFLQVETAVIQGSDTAFGFQGARCTGNSQKVTITNTSDPFFPDIAFEPGRATARATVFGCPTGEEEFCSGFITEEITTVKLVR